MHTIFFASLETPFQVNLSVNLAKVFLNPRCPDVGSA